MKLEFNELSDYYDDNSTQEVDSMKNNEFSVGDIVVHDDRVYIVVRAPEILIREAEVAESEAVEFWIQTKEVRHYE
jgi:hypothetical protein